MLYCPAAPLPNSLTLSLVPLVIIYKSALCALEWDVQLILKTYGLILDTDEYGA